MPELIPYDRQAAVRYAHEWAFRRNPEYLDFETIGGDCTNFASQCLFAGAGVMNHTPTFGWYYYSAEDRAPAWTGVSYFYNFLVRKRKDQGPFGVEIPVEQVQPGDFVQLRFQSAQFTHNPVVVATGRQPTLNNILVAAHSQDADLRPLSSYPGNGYRFLHILGVRR